MTSEYLLNTGPELLEDISSCVTAYDRPEIAEGPRDGLNLIRNKFLGGHFKTGHAWTSQNRPWRMA